MSARAGDPRPLIAHVVFSFDYGGLENGVVNVINGLPDDFRHVVIALTTASSFRDRIRRTDVEVHALDKQPGKDPGAYLRLYRLLRRLRPDVVHTRNLSTLEGSLVARLAGVPHRIHGEHGWDVFDPDGTNPKYRAMRRFCSGSIHEFVALSGELEVWLKGFVGIEASKVRRICNGVDTVKFRPRSAGDASPLPAEMFPPGSLVVGTVARLSAIKDPMNVVRAFVEARRDPACATLRLLVAGEGALRGEMEAYLHAHGAAPYAWLPGSRDDVAELLRAMDVFVLGSRREGISNTILEAMATALPAIVTATGGNVELVRDGECGWHVPPGDPSAIAARVVEYARDPALRARHGAASRARVEAEFSLAGMLRRYESLYRGATAKLSRAA
jgi:sugar transferase (PEP-CTERM/EpsH1 system associated)